MSTKTTSTFAKKKIIPKFVNISNISTHLYCCICEEMFRKPIRIKEYGHVFCKLCLKKLVKYNKNCPLCRKLFDFKNTRKDIIAYNIINDLEVFCNNNCPWKGKLSDLKKHLKKCNFNPKKMSNSIKKVIEDKNKINSLNLNINTTKDENDVTKDDKKTDNEEGESEGTSVDSLTSFNTRVNLRARLFNRNKDLGNEVLNKEKTKGYSEYSIFSIIDENNIKI